MARGGIDTPIGALSVTTTSIGVCRVEFGAVLGPSAVLGDSSSSRRHLCLALSQLEEYFGRRRRSFTVPIDRSGRSGFRGEVLAALEGVGFGEVVTYGELAIRSGRPRASRAVGTAMATNPIPVLVPCHRVVRSGGSAGNYGGGTEAKLWLLAMEAENPEGVMAEAEQ